MSTRWEISFQVKTNFAIDTEKKKEQKKLKNEIKYKERIGLKWLFMFFDHECIWLKAYSRERTFLKADFAKRAVRSVFFNFFPEVTPCFKQYEKKDCIYRRF